MGRHVDKCILRGVLFQINQTWSCTICSAYNMKQRCYMYNCFTPNIFSYRISSTNMCLYEKSRLLWIQFDMFSRHIGYTVTVYRSMIFPSQFVSVNGHWYSIISTYHICLFHFTEWQARIYRHKPCAEVADETKSPSYLSESYIIQLLYIYPISVKSSHLVGVGTQVKRLDM